MKTESDPIEKEVDRVLFEMYSPYLKLFHKECDTFCGITCLCKKRISVTERERIRQVIEIVMRV